MQVQGGGRPSVRVRGIAGWRGGVVGSMSETNAAWMLPKLQLLLLLSWKQSPKT